MTNNGVKNATTETEGLPDEAGTFEYHRGKDEWVRIEEYGDLRCFHDAPKQLVRVVWAGVASRSLPEMQIDWVCDRCLRASQEIISTSEEAVMDGDSPPITSVDRIKEA